MRRGRGSLASRAREPVAVLLATLVVLVAATGVVTAAGSTTVSITPETDEVDVGGTTTFRVVVDSADGGVGAAEIGIAVDDPDVAAITAVRVLGTGSQEVEIADDGASADVEYAFRDTADTGEVRVLEVTLEGRADGETTLSLEAAAGNDGVLVFDEGGQGYTVTGTRGATLTVGDGETTADDSGSGGGGGAGGRDGSDGSDGSDGGQTGGGATDGVEVLNRTLLNGTVTTGADVAVRVELSNPGSVRRSIGLRLAANGSTVAERSVGVEATSERAVVLRHAFDRPGTYDLSVNGRTVGTVTVTETSTPTDTPSPTPEVDTRTVTPTVTPEATATPPTETEPSETEGSPPSTTGDGAGFGPLVALLAVTVVALRLWRY